MFKCLLLGSSYISYHLRPHAMKNIISRPSKADERWSAPITAKIIVPSAGAHGLDLRAIRIQPAFSRVGGPTWTQCLLPILSRGVLLSLGNIGPVISSNQIICIRSQHLPGCGKLQSALLRPDYPASLGGKSGTRRNGLEVFGPMLEA